MLEAQEAIILQMRFGLNGEDALSLRAIGQKVDLSIERTRQIQFRAFHKMCEEYYRRLVKKGIKTYEDYFSLPVDYIRLNIRGKKTCIRKSINTIGELIACLVEDLLEVRNCGMVTVNEIREKLSRINLKLKGD